MDGYTRLLYAIFGRKIERPLICRVCGCTIESKTNGKGYICLDCYRVQGSERARWYYLQNPDTIKATVKRWGLKHPEALRAHALANYYYPEAQVCSVEGRSNIAHRHHPDYSKPREIGWLCALHHKQVVK